MIEKYQVPYECGSLESHDHFCNTYTPFIDLICEEVDSNYRLGEFSCGDARTSKALMYMLPTHRFNLYDIKECESSVKRNLGNKKYKYNFVPVANYKDMAFNKQFHSLIYSFGVLNYLDFNQIRSLLRRTRPHCQKMVHLVWGDKAREIFDDPIKYYPLCDWIQNLDTTDMFFRSHEYYYLIGWRGENVWTRV